MKNPDLKDLYLNWKWLELMHGIKSLLKVVIIILSIIFIYISFQIQNYYVLGASLILIFLQVPSENNKEYYLKYKELFHKVQSGNKIQSYKEWIEFLEKTKGINWVHKAIIGLVYNKRFKDEYEKKGKL